MTEGFIQLEIGDWVKPKKSAWPFKVSGITEQGVTKEGPYYYKYDEIEPIPLTPEILEKNGFEREGEASRCRIDRWWLSVLHWNKDRLELIISDDSTKLYILDIDLKYVHQLQHVLRLCGINKNYKL